MEALKLETWQPEPCGGVGYASAGHLSAVSTARGSGDERYADLLAWRAETAPQTRGPTGDRDGAEGRPQDLETVPSHLPWVSVQDNEEAGVMERTLSGPAVPDNAVSADSAPACVETPAPAAPAGDPLGNWGTARLRCTPRREQVRLCELGSVKNGWLPVHKRALLFGVPLHVRNSETPPSQEKMKAYIAVTTPKGYTKKLNGNGYIDGNRVEKCAQPMSFGALRSLSHPNINQASSCQNTSDRDREKNMYEVKTCWAPRSGFVQPNSSLASGGVALYRGSLLQRTIGAPGAPYHEDTDPKNPPKTKASFSSITITARRVPQTASAASPDGPGPGCFPQTRGPASQAVGNVTQALRAHPPQVVSSAPSPTPLRTVADGDPEPVVLRKKPVIIKLTERQQAYRSGESPAANRPPNFRHSYSEGDHKMAALHGFQGRLRDSRAQSVRSCARLDLPATSSNSVLYLDRSLSISVQEPESTSEVHRSTLTLYLSGASPSEAPDGPRRALSLHPKPAPPEPGAPAPKHGSPKPPETWGPRAVSDGPSDSNARSWASAPSLGDDAPRLETARHSGKPGGGARPRPGATETPLPVCGQPRERVVHKGLGVIFAGSPDPVIAEMKRPRKIMPNSMTAQAPPDSGVAVAGEDAGNRSKSLRVEGVVLRGPRRTVCENGPSRPSSWTGSFPMSQSSIPNALTLREALALYRPDFISRSLGRVKKLEERAQKRRADQNSDTVLEPARGRRRRNCTKPHPLSDNLFKPRERSISRKDMQLRSKRIYNNLPEVTRRKEEEKRKVLSQTNRLRAEIFKKKLLDQILQRNGD